MNRCIYVGVDEAGRGCLIGDLVISLVAVSEEGLYVLKNIGVRDSKELSPRKRSEFVEQILSLSSFTLTTYIPPLKIDKAVGDDGLNMLETDIVLNMFRCMKPFIEIFDLSVRIYIDEIKGYEDFIEKSLRPMYRDRLQELVIESRADKKYTVVSAASIVAKYFRDLNIGSIKTILGDFGSGYPSDPRTREWITNIYSTYRRPLRVIRRSWATLKKIAPDWYRDLRMPKITDYM